MMNTVIAGAGSIPPVGAEALKVTLGKPVAFGFSTADDVWVAAAANAAPGTRDPVDLAILAAAAARHDIRTVEAIDYSAATPERGYSLATVRRPTGGEIQRIARGRLDAILHLCRVDSLTATKARAAAALLTADRLRPLAVAVAPGTEGEDFRFLGLLPLRATRTRRRRDKQTPYVFNPVWSATQRFLHWFWVLLVTLLIITGFEIQTAYLTPETTRLDPGYFFGYVRLIHYLCGWLLIAVFVWRMAHALFTDNRFAGWKALLPFRRKRDIGDFFAVLRDYLLFRTDDGKSYLGHNPLQQLSYTLVYGLMLGSIVTGLALYGLYDPTHGFFRWFQWPNQWFGVATVRLIHTLLMWAFVLFIPIHLYLCIRADTYDREGAISSMLSGGRWVRQGARLEDE